MTLCSVHMSKCSLPSLPSLALLSVNATGTGAPTADEETAPPSSKRPRRARLPCPDELRYEDGEILNTDKSYRIQGSSSSFDRNKLNIIPLTPPFPASWEELLPIMSNFHVGNVDKILYELYRRDGFDASRKKTSSEGNAYERTTGNFHRQQYYLKTLTEPAAVSHIINDGEFFRFDEDDEHIVPQTTIYTHGFIWCNTSPNWMWKASDPHGKLMRCRILLPVGTQVVVDRSPVYDNECQFDEARTSIFPDVLLPPGQFEITSVARYRDDGEDEDDDDDDMDYRDSANVVTLEPAPAKRVSTVMTDEEYAQSMLMDARKFVDVRLTATAMMRLPVLDVTI